MKLLYAASEAMPFVSAGGLSDVVGSLPRAVRDALAAAGENADIRIVLPLYASVRRRFSDRLTRVCEIPVRLAWRNQTASVWQTEADGIVWYFIENDYYFLRDALYGAFDDGERFAFFSKALLEMLPAVGFRPDLLHCNDWQTAPAVIYLKRRYSRLPFYRGIAALMTVHNIDYQGVYDMSLLSDTFEFGEWDRSTVEHGGKLNLLKGAAICSDMVSTVSPTYSREILTEQVASGLHYILRTADNEGRLTGILNGIDTEYYDPARDGDIPAAFTPDDLSGKAADKAALQQECGLTADLAAPVMVMVSRLAPHKGFDLVRSGMESILSGTGVQLAVTGVGEPAIERYLTGLAEQFPGRVAYRGEFNKKLSKLFYAGGDVLLMPSRSEPCGLPQMIAARYGTVPVVRACGGLADTVRPWDGETGTGIGFTFRGYDAFDMQDAVDRALALYENKPEWDRVVRSAMSADFSWNVSAAKYLALYHTMTDL